jgi:hypothetical protein
MYLHELRLKGFLTGQSPLRQRQSLKKDQYGLIGCDDLARFVGYRVTRI